jgi:hypothetical protein
MARHYYRTNVPLPIMIIWWVFLGVCDVIIMVGAFEAAGAGTAGSCSRSGSNQKVIINLFRGVNLSVLDSFSQQSLFSVHKLVQFC